MPAQWATSLECRLFFRASAKTDIKDNMLLSDNMWAYSDRRHPYSPMKVFIRNVSGRLGGFKCQNHHFTGRHEALLEFSSSRQRFKPKYLKFVQGV